MGDTSGALDAFASGSGGLLSDAVGVPVTNGVDLIPRTLDTGTGSGLLPSLFQFQNQGAGVGGVRPTLPYQSALTQVPGAGAIAGDIFPYLVIGGFFLAAVLLMTR